MKITIYTISNDPFCNQAKDFLNSKGVQFEEKNVQENREFLTEMLDVSNKFAGVPFTMIEKDSGEKVSLKGFTQNEFELALGAGSGGGAGAGSSGAASTDAMPTSKPAAPDNGMPAIGDKPATGGTMPTTDTSAMPASTATTGTTGTQPMSTPPPQQSSSAPAVSSMPDLAPNMPSMPSIDEAPQGVVPGGSNAPATPAPAMPTPPSTPPAGSTQAPQNQLDGILADLQTKTQ